MPFYCNEVVRGWTCLLQWSTKNSKPFKWFSENGAFLHSLDIFSLTINNYQTEPTRPISCQLFILLQWTILGLSPSNNIQTLPQSNSIMHFPNLNNFILSRPKKRMPNAWYQWDIVHRIFGLPRIIWRSVPRTNWVCRHGCRGK